MTPCSLAASLTGGVRPRPDGDAQVTGGSVDRLAQRHGPPAVVEPMAAMIGEDDTVGIIGIAPYAQMAEVVQAMMPPAQRQQIRGIGGPAVLPVLDMVHMQPGTRLQHPCEQAHQSAGVAFSTPQVRAISAISSLDSGSR